MSWIDVNEDVPNTMSGVFTYNGTVQTGFYRKEDNQWYDDDFGDELYNVTHWMPITLPEPPITNHAKQ